MTDEKPKRVISDIRPPVRKPQPKPKVPAKAPVVEKLSEDFTQEARAEHAEQPLGKKVIFLSVITILFIAIWLVYINYFS